ncbi:MAG TPA: adenylate/guanylate cyclase domain-containing protein, partial [Candidatus Limnocylindria bacterium]|nr:adenylate/guanylate cyclase domain-containing protein [Candidatus Limnocylindria bacterium]
MSISTSISDERRLVTVLFVDMVGFTHRAEEADPEQVREIQRSYFETVAAEVERYGGRVEKYIGDAVMAIFGVPRAHDDDPERALHAALALRAAVAAMTHAIEIRVGVNTGEVVGGPAPGTRTDEYTVTGDAVNVAARLQQAADAGDILVGATTRRLARDRFEFVAVPPLDLKGKAEPVEAWRVVAALPERTRVRGGEAPLVGRRRELALLDAALDDAADGHQLIITLSGEAGIGKSRLALETRARAQERGFAAVWATAVSYRSAFPYYLVTQLVEQLAGRHSPAELRTVLVGIAQRDAEPTTVGRWVAALDELRDPDSPEAATLAGVTPEARQHLVVQALAALLAHRAAERPQLIVLDDLQWADASSLAVLDELLALTSGEPVLVLMLQRPGWSNPWSNRGNYQQLNLDRLRDREARELIRSLNAGAEMDQELAAELLERSGGNPFFLEELVRASAHGDGGRVPETVHELLLARIDALPADARKLLQTASVIGMEFGERALAAVSQPNGDIDGGLRTLQRDDLVIVRGGDIHDRLFAMRHPLVHEVAYRSLLLSRRRELHRLIAGWLEEHEGDEALAEIAEHYRNSDDLDKARHYLPLAADRAARVNAQREALDRYIHAAALFADDPARRGLMLERAATQSYILGDPEHPASDLVTEAIELYEAAGDRLHALDAHRWRGRYYWFEGRGREAEAEVITAIEGLEQLPPSPELALAYSYRSQLRMLMPDFVTGERLARRAIEVAEQVGSTEALVHALNNLGVCRQGLGDPGGLQDLRRSLELALAHNLTDDAMRAYTNMSTQGTAISLFTPDESQALYDEMLAYDARVAPGAVYETWHRAGQSEFWIATGRWDDAERSLREIAPIHITNRYVQLDIAAFDALLAAYRGRYDEAATRVRPWIETAVQIDDLQAYGPAFIALGHVERGLGSHEAAAAAIERGIGLMGEAPDSKLSSWYLFEAVDIAAWLRDANADGPLVDHILPAIDRLITSLAQRRGLGGTPPELLVARALYGSAEVLRRLLSEAPHDRAGVQGQLLAWADDLDSVRRVFDA